VFFFPVALKLDIINEILGSHGVEDVGVGLLGSNIV
jgi:hypothetical protein